VAQLKDRLEAVIRGESKPSDVKAWLDQVLADGSVSPAELLADLDACAAINVPGPIITAFRSDIERKAAAAPAPATSDPSPFGDLTLDLPDAAPATPAAPASNTEAPSLDFGDLSLDMPVEAAAAPEAPPAAPEPSAPAPAAGEDNPFGNLTLDVPEEPAPSAPAAEQPAAAAPEGLDEAALFDLAAAEMGASPAAQEEPALDKTLIASDEEDSDETIVAGGDDPDSTLVTNLPVDEDATVVTGNERTVATGDGTYDPFAISEVPATGTSWPSAQVPGHGEVGPGTVLKERFELMEKLGEGGMGAVYKARDLLKVEAQDRNPYVAVKLLSGDFKEHPEAFIALQRESSKAQKLAHPNIATVYDFDRDRGTVYMTMEVLQGQELNEFIKKTIPDEGLEVPEAMDIIQQLCEGLKYAHNRGLVHSDFKPGNAFLLTDGTVKLLDFGIARASAVKANAEGEKTLFDPGALGALTPAYATIEMFEGLAPDPRDDIYALACTAFELLNKKHPFKKRSAVKAREMGLKPEVLKKLTRRQNKILARGLGFTRAERPDTVEEFWDEIRPRKDYRPHIAAAAATVLLGISALAYGPITSYLEERDDLAFVAQVRSQGPHTVETLTTALEPVLEMSVESHDRILDIMQEEYIGLLNRTVAEIADPQAQQYQYAKALQLYEGALHIYSDNVELALNRRDIVDEQRSIASDRTNAIDQILADGTLSVDESDVLTENLSIVAQVDPSQPIMTDPRIPEGFAGLADEARLAGDLQGASSYLSVGLQYTPDNPLLVDLKSRVDNAIRQQENAARIGELEVQLNGLLAQAVNADTAAPLIEPLVELQALQPENTIIPRSRERVRSILAGELAAAAQVSDFARAEDLLAQFARGVAIPWLMEQRESLSRTELAAGFQPADLGSRLTALSTLRDALEALLQRPTMDVVWESDVRSNFLDIIARMQTGDTWVEDLQRDIADAYLVQARDRMTRDLYLQAQESIDKAERYYPTYAELTVVNSEFNAAQAAYETRVAEERRVARINTLKSLVRNNAQNGEMAAALSNLTELRSGDIALPTNDAFLTAEAPQLMAAGYEAAARREVGRLAFTTAASFAEQGLQYQPGSQSLTELRNAAQRAARLQQSARAVTVTTVAALDRDLREVTGSFPESATAIRNSVLQIAASKVDSTTDVDAAVGLMNALKSQFSNDRIIQALRVDTSRQPLRLAADIQGALDGALLTRAEQLIQQANRDQPNNAAIGPFQQELSNRKTAFNATIASLQSAMTSGNSQAARGFLAQAESQWTDNPTLAQYRAQLGVSSSSSASPTVAADGSKFCRSNLAGQGTRGARAYCFDMVGGEQGPDLVVVPAGSGLPDFAISRTEVTIGAFNRFCQATGQCSAVGGDADLPATGMSFTQAQGYAQWLAQQTRKNYHIPSAQEWLYAATSTDAEANRSDWNCRVVQGGSILKGGALLPAATGRPNPWGLVHVAGNAQEFVADGSAHGGAHTDPLTECSVSMSRPATGDAPTGFRVARSLDN